MAKKSNIEGPIFPESPLIISRNEFKSLLNLQLLKGKELLEIDVPQKGYAPSHLHYGNYGNHRIIYEEPAKTNFIGQCERWNDRNKSIYRSSFSDSNNIYYNEYISGISSLRIGIDDVKEMKEQVNWLVNHILSDIERIDLMKCDIQEVTSINSEIKKLSQEIFIVHGHNEEMKQTVARVVSQLGLKPIILHEQPNEGKTIIEKFERNAEDINFAIILLSADDMAASVRDLNGVKEDELRQHLEMRARQNVVFEMGYFTGKLGRSKVFFLLQDGVAKPGDLDGIVYTAYDAARVWRFDLVKELQNAGYKVSADKVL